MTGASYAAALARVRDLLVHYEGRAGTEIDSADLKLRTQEAARVAYGADVAFSVFCADLDRTVTEALPRDQLTASTIGRAMVRWAAPVYHIHEPLA